MFARGGLVADREGGKSSFAEEGRVGDTEHYHRVRWRLRSSKPKQVTQSLLQSARETRLSRRFLGFTTYTFTGQHLRVFRALFTLAVLDVDCESVLAGLAVGVGGW